MVLVLAVGTSRVFVLLLLATILVATLYRLPYVSEYSMLLLAIHIPE